MGGELQECGCFDGPHAEDDRTLISVRCTKHRDVAALDGYRLRYRDAFGRVVIPRPPGYPRGRRMDIPKGKRR